MASLSQKPVPCVMTVHAHGMVQYVCRVWYGMVGSVHVHDLNTQNAEMQKCRTRKCINTKHADHSQPRRPSRQDPAAIGITWEPNGYRRVKNLTNLCKSWRRRTLKLMISVRADLHVKILRPSSSPGSQTVTGQESN
jgi:hypothetical protein